MSSSAAVSTRAEPTSAGGRSFRFVWTWLPAALAVVMIMTESTGTFSAVNTSSWLRPIFERVLGPIDDTVWWWGHHLFRKSGHFCGYGLVALSFLRAGLLTLRSRLALTVGARRRLAVIFGLLTTAAIATLDEVHQTTLPSRNGAFADVVLDTAGGAVTCALVALLLFRAPPFGQRLRRLRAGGERRLRARAQAHRSADVP